MFLEAFSANLKCPECNKMHPHLIHDIVIHFNVKQITFLASCSMCDKKSFMLNGVPSQPFMYKCDYIYYDEIEPLDDKVNPN